MMADTTKPPNRLTLAWWNLHNFAHYDADRSSLERRPKQMGHYTEKRDRILAVFEELVGSGFPDLFAVGEITREAAQDLITRLPSGFDVAVAPASAYEDEFQVAVIYREGINLTPELPLIPTETEDVSRSTRSMMPIHLTLPGHVIRFVACHWTGFDEDSSRTARGRLADYLRRDIYDFLHPEVPNPEVARHVVVLGDLNEEPMSDLFKSNFDGRWDRKSSRESHWRDKKVRRVRLYNLAWRYLGEQIPHRGGGSMATGPAGTWYNSKRLIRDSGVLREVRSRISAEPCLGGGHWARTRRIPGTTADVPARSLDAGGAGSAAETRSLPSC